MPRNFRNKRNPFPEDILYKPRSKAERIYIKKKTFLERALGIFSKSTLCKAAESLTDIECVGNESRKKLISFIISTKSNVKRAKPIVRTLLADIPEEEFDEIYSSFGLTPKANRGRAAAYLMQALRFNLGDTLPQLRKTISKAEKKYREDLVKQKRQILVEARAVRSANAAERRESRARKQYKEHVIDFLARKRLADIAGLDAVSRRNYAISKKLDYSQFSKFLTEFQEQVEDEVSYRYHELEEARLKALRDPLIDKPKHDPWEKITGAPSRKKPTSARDRILKELQKIAKKPLPRKRGPGGGYVVFSKDPDENDRKMQMWLEIAEDVMDIGLNHAVAQEWLSELRVPAQLPQHDILDLVLLRIETVLKQLNLFEPSTERLTFSRINQWKAKKAQEELEPEIVDIEEEEIFEVDEDFDEEAWLEKQIELEEAEKRRFIHTPEEQQRRLDANLRLDSDLDRLLSRSDRTKLTAIGAMYDPTIGWLLPTQEDLNDLVDKLSPRQKLKGWSLTRKPRLLVGIGTTDYTKPWMRRSFELLTINSTNSLSSSIVSFKPDALMIYKSSTGRHLYRAFKQAALDTGLPLIIFDKGFSDALLSAEQQSVAWFVDAYEQRKSRRLRRYNPITPRHRNRRLRKRYY